MSSEIDVSKCEFYNNCCCNCYIDNYGDCYHKCTDEELKNCYYKQLQKLKAENEELRNKNNSIHSIADSLQKRNHYLTQKNERYIQCFNEINEICSNSLSVKLLFKDRMDLAIFIRRRIKEVKKDG